jgi:hypothetical protein
MLSRAFFLSASEFSVGAGCAPDCDWLLCASEGAAASKKANNPNRFSLRQIERFITPLAAPLDSEGHSPEKATREQRCQRRRAGNTVRCDRIADLSMPSDGSQETLARFRIA